MNNYNSVLLEGTVLFTPEMKEHAGKHALNFVLENERTTKNGVEKFNYHCVMWDRTIERFGSAIQKGTFLRVSGHLQDSIMKIDSGKTENGESVMKDFHYMKVCVDFVKIM